MATQPISPYSALTLQGQVPALAPTRERQSTEAVGGAASSTENDATHRVSPGDTTTNAPPSQPLNREQIDQAMKKVQEALPFTAQNLQFSIDEDTGRTIVKVVDTTTKEIIRQIPSEELLAITRELDKFSGLLVKQKV